MIERRFVKGQQIKVRTGAKPAIEGYAAVFNQQYDSGWFIETIKPGAFARALREKQDVRCLFNHDPNNLLGRTKANTLTLAEDTSGLHYVCDMNPDTRVATEVHAMVSRGDLDGCSFAFMVTKQTWREEKEDPNDPKSRMVQYRDIEDLDLYDVGPVTYPAYEGTSVGSRALWPDGVPAEIRSHVPALSEIRITDTPGNPGDGEGGEEDPEPDDDDVQECSCHCRACFSGECSACDQYMETCGDPAHCGDAMRWGHFIITGEKRDDSNTKKVAGENLPQSAFAYVGNPDDKATWKLPIKFSSDEKSKSHIRNALARWSSTDMPNAEAKAKAWKKLVAAAHKYGIHVAGEDDKKAADIAALEQARARTETLLAELSLIQ